MNISTSFEYPPIPDRRFDWLAVDDDTYDGEGCPIGHGRTEAEAVLDLLDQIEANLEPEDARNHTVERIRSEWILKTMEPE